MIMRRLLRATLLLLGLYGSAVAALTEVYVDLAATGTGHAGTTADPLSWEQLGDLMEVNNTDQAGKRFNIRGSITLTATDTWLADGTATSPIVLRGCTGSGTTWTPITPARSNGGTGPLVTTFYPVITYNGNYTLDLTGSISVVFSAMSFSSSRTGSYSGAVYSGARQLFYGCTFTATGDDARAVLAGEQTTLVMCDASHTGTSANPSQDAIYLSGGRAIGCMVKQSSNIGISCGGSTTAVINCVIYGVRSYGISFVSTTVTHGTVLINNTVYGGKGIGFADYAYSVPHIIIGNHVTESSVYGINGPSTASASAFLALNRTRDNTSGAISWNGDWATATTFGHVTTDNGDHLTDFYNAAGYDFRLVSDAAGVGQGIMGADIGAIQRADPTLPDASTVLSEAYGGSTWGDSFALRRGTATLPAAANVWYGTGSFGLLWATEATVRGTMGNDGENLIFTSYSPLPAGVEVGHEIMIAGKWAEISAINVARTESTIVNQEAGFPESGTLLLATISSTGLTPVVPSKRASSITVTNGAGATLSAQDIKSGVIVDDVTGSLSGGGLTAQELRNAMELDSSGTAIDPDEVVDTEQEARDAMELDSSD